MAGVRSASATSPAEDSARIRSASRPRPSTSPALLDSSIDGALTSIAETSPAEECSSTGSDATRFSTLTSPECDSARTSVPEGTRIS